MYRTDPRSYMGPIKSKKLVKSKYGGGERGGEREQWGRKFVFNTKSMVPRTKTGFHELRQVCT